MVTSMRLDVLLVHRGLAESRQKAQAIIEAGCVLVNGKPVCKSSAQIEDTAELHLEGELPLHYVGRGGLKLERALEAFGLDVTNLTAVDIGASTGGFTDCLLQRGAAKVFAVDSGKGQLHPSLLADQRVISLEECNAKTLSEAILGQLVDLAVMDVSFTSQVLLYGGVTAVLKQDGRLISLIKPQFEAGRNAVGKKGIVRDRKFWESSCLHVLEQAELMGLYAQKLIPSPITGGDGNVEFLALFHRQSPRLVNNDSVRRIIHSL